MCFLMNQQTDTRDNSERYTEYGVGLLSDELATAGTTNSTHSVRVTLSMSTRQRREAGDSGQLVDRAWRTCRNTLSVIPRRFLPGGEEESRDENGRRSDNDDVDWEGRETSSQSDTTVLLLRGTCHVDTATPTCSHSQIPWKFPLAKRKQNIRELQAQQRDPLRTRLHCCSTTRRICFVSFLLLLFSPPALKGEVYFFSVLFTY